MKNGCNHLLMKPTSPLNVASGFAKNLARIRTDADLTQEELAVRAQMDRAAINALESGRRVPRIDTLLRIAAALDIPPGEFLDGIEWEPGETEPGRFRIARPGEAEERS